MKNDEDLKTQTNHEGWRHFLQKLSEPDEFGIAGALRKADIFHETSVAMPDFRQLCNADRPLNRIFLSHAGERLSQLRKIQGDQLEAFAVFCLIIKERHEFEDILAEARCLKNVHAIKLLDDIDEIIDRELVPRADGSPIEIFGMEFTYEPHPSEEQITRRAYELWESAGRPEGQDEDFYHRAERDLLGIPEQPLEAWCGKLFGNDS